MNESKPKNLQENKPNTEHISISLSPNNKKFLPWIIALISIVCVVALFISLNSHRQAQKEMQEQLERQNLVIDSLEKKQGEKVDTSKSIPVITSETLKSQLNSLQELVTQEYIYTNADKRTDNAKWLFGWARPFSDTSLVLTYDGVIKAGINMNEVQIDINEDTRTITVTLPDSKIMDNNIPQESITVVEVKNGLFNEITFDDYNAFISEQKIIMEQKAIDRGLLETADKEARETIQAFLSVMPGMTGEDAYTLIVQ